MQRKACGRILTWLIVFVVIGLAGAFDADAQPIGVRPWLGVAMDTDGPSSGARVGHVVRGSPADQAGLREGDRIVRLAGTAVARSADVVRIVGASSVGTSLELAFVHGGQE